MGQLPHNPEAERAVLGAILIDPAVLNELADLVTPADFHLPRHRVVYAAMLGLARAGQPIDTITLESKLRTSNELGLAGGVEGIGKLADAWASAQQARHHAATVRDLGAMRRLVVLARKIAEEGCGPVDNPREWIGSAEQRVLAASAVTGSTGYVPIGERVNAVVRGMATEADTARRAHEAGRPTPCTGVRTGYSRLDQMTGGLQPGDLVVLAARPSMGKTSLALNIASEAAKERIPVLIFSMEMSTDQIVRRQVCTEASIDAMDVREGRLTTADHEDLVRVGGLVAQLPIAVDERAAQSITAIRSAARRWRRDPRFFPRAPADQDPSRPPLGLVVVDYIQLGHGEDGTRTDTRNLEVGQISAGCKAMAKELGVPVLALSQLNRAVDSREDHRPRLSDLRDSGTIEQDADVIAFIHRSVVYEQDADGEGRRDAELILAKQRNGPTGSLALTWQEEHTRFIDPLVSQPTASLP